MPRRMIKNRYMSINKFRKMFGLDSKKEGNNWLCVWCGTVIRKDKRRRYCSSYCKKAHQKLLDEEYAICSSSTAIREQVFERDGGVCSGCGVDTVQLEQQFLDTYRAIDTIKDGEKRVAEKQNLLNRFVELGYANVLHFNGKNITFWEAHHILAVADGGGQCNLEGFVTLCYKCHRQITLEANKNRRQKKR